MTKNSFLVLKKEIEKELKDLEKLEKEMNEVLSHSEPSFLETRAAGSILHDFYSGIEKIFRRVAFRIDRDIPSGEDWHTELLIRMSIPIAGIRPNVISEGLKEQLAEYLRFRHLFRNIYGFELKWERCKTLGVMLKEILNVFKKEIAVFLKFTDSLENNL
ncbi:MAG: hypothetical protein HY999_02110 [Nitrospinae bacterium]|nr:hypothetical protein [Nitrospinota bacterium]